MSKWRHLAIELFPEYNKGSWAFQRGDMSLCMIFFELKYDLDKKTETEDTEWIRNVFIYCEWCFKQRRRNHGIWNQAATAFVEHLADEDARAELIPIWVKPDMFEDMQYEFMKRREWEGKGKAQILFDEYNKVHGTAFELDHDWLIDRTRSKMYNEDKSRMALIEPLEDGSYSIEIYRWDKGEASESDIERDNFWEPMSSFVTDTYTGASKMAKEELGIW
jgi:hypothetical protein